MRMRSKREDCQLRIRMPKPMKRQIHASAETNGRSMNAEILVRLQSSFVTSKKVEEINQFENVIE